MNNVIEQIAKAINSSMLSPSQAELVRELVED